MEDLYRGSANREPDLWLSWWSKANAESPNKDLGKYLGVYVALQISTLISVMLWVWYVASEKICEVA